MTIIFVWPDNSFVLEEDYEDVREQWRGDDFRRVYAPDNMLYEDIPQYIEYEAEAEAISSKWLWMMDYCKKHGLAPANHKAWEQAELAFQRSQSKGGVS